MEWNTDTAHNLMTRVVNKKGCRNILSKKNRIVMPGARHFRPLSFIPVNLGKYEMPNDILTTVSKNDNKNFLDQMIELQKILPYLKQDLCEENYKARFHTLLFLEEIMHLNKISRLQMESSFRAVNGLFIITLPDNEDINLLGVGDRVYADTAWKDLTEDIMYEGFIEQISGNDIYVNFHREFEKQEAEGRFYRIQFETSRSVFRRKHQAVDVCAKHLGYDWLFPTRMTIRKAQIKIIDEKEDCGSNDNRCTVSKTELKKRIAWNHLGHGLGSKAKIWNNDKPYVDVCLTAKINWFNTKLNKEQKTCIKNILEGIARPLPYIIFGPPGTGKTFTLTELIFQISMLIPGSRLLIAAASNSAIDILACNLMNTGLKKSDMVRLLSHKYANQGRLPVKLMSVSAIPVFDFKLSEDSTNAYGVRTISRDLIGRQKVTMGTLSLLGILYNMGFPSGHFTHIIIDEAGQATEPEMLIPVGFLNKHFGQLILAGDPMQLGPVVLSELALRFGLKESYLNRIISRFPFTQDPYQFEGSSGFDPRLITKLRHNYRALPSIVSLYSELFYNNELISEVCVPESWEYNKLMNVADIFTTSNKQLYPVLFHGIDGLEAIEPGSTSYYNKFEVMQVIIYLKRMYALKVKPEEVGVVTPYTSQVKKINQLCNEFGIEGPKVGTVEEFQGQERDFIIISTVRTSTHLNPSHFICNPRRFNVSISRCKSGLIIIGNPAAIGRIKEWNYILKLCLRQKSYKGVPFPTGTL